MLKVAITGGIGSGKSLVSNIFNIIGIPVYNSDYKAKMLMQQNPDLIKQIKDNFGSQSYDADKLNTKYLSNIVFKNSSKLKTLNELVHPFVMNDFENWLREEPKTEYKLFESAIIFENKLEHLFDYIIVISSPKYVRIKRVKEREKISVNEINKRIENQIDERIKINKADFIIKNHNQLIIPQIIDIHNKLNKLTNHG